MYVAVGRYIVFWDDFYKTREKNFLPDASKTYFVWTDDDKKDFPSNVVKIKQKNLGWPDSTFLPYDRNPKTQAYVPYGNEGRYVMGSFNGGTGPAFVRLIEDLNKITNEDRQKGVMPVWYDESYLNRYILDKDPLFLTPDYGYPELNAVTSNPVVQAFKGKVKIIILEKDQAKYGGKRYLRGLE